MCLFALSSDCDLINFTDGGGRGQSLTPKKYEVSIVAKIGLPGGYYPQNFDKANMLTV